jgi:hypothetical protein
MGLLDMVKGLLGGETAQGLLEATGLGDHVEGLIGEPASTSARSPNHSPAASATPSRASPTAGSNRLSAPRELMR